MATTIADLWFLTPDDRPLDLREPMFSSDQIENEVSLANAANRDGRTDWTAIDLEEVILQHVEKVRAIAAFYAHHHLRPSIYLGKTPR